MEKKRTIWHFVICVGLVCLIWGGYFFGIKKIRQQIDEVRADDFSWVVQVDNVSTEKGKLILKGFAFKTNEEVTEKEYEIVLHNLKNDKFYFPQMEYVNREDVNDYFLCEYDYASSGFVAKFSEKKLKFKENDYEILIRIKDDDKARKIGTFLSQGERIHTDPTNYVPLDVSNEKLSKIINESVLKVYEPKNHIYVYQNKNYLYWITEKEYDFVDGNTWIQCQAQTTQVDKLPSESKGKEISEIGFWYTDYEVLDLQDDSYRVARSTIPTEYSITNLRIGNWNSSDGWIWMTYFRPDFLSIK